MPYFILMTGFAAVGLCYFYDFFAAKFGNVKWLAFILRFPKPEPSVIETEAVPAENNA